MLGKILSHYKILEKIGEGGMGVVYKAEDMKLKRTVALKFLPAHLSSDRELRERFEREAQAAAAFIHPNIITIYEVGEYEGKIYIAMEYVEGESLQKKLSESKNVHSQLSVDEILDITTQICEGLSKAHETGIVHRDIKPANILIDNDGRVKLVDFGLAKLKGVSKLTKEISTIGTIKYMSPEQALGEEVDYQSDIWSLGVVLYEMLTGQLPFRGKYEQIIFYSIINAEPEDIRESRKDISSDLESIVNKTLQKGKEYRYQTINELHVDLLKFQESANILNKSQPSIFIKNGFKKKKIKNRIKAATVFLNYLYQSKPLTRILLYIAGTLFLGFIFFLIQPFIFDKTKILEQKSIAVISFKNKTGDKAHDYLQAAIPNLLITSLEQSKNLRVTTWERLHDLMRQVGRDSVETISENLGFQLCFMDDIDILVLGDFAKIDETFTTNLKVLDVKTERVIKTVNTKGAGVSSILKKQIDELTCEISRGIGISDNLIAATQQPITEVTTSSIDAYNYFLRGREDWEKFYHDDARRFLEKAIQLDSTFAVAYLYLGSTYGGLGETKSMITAYEKAKVYTQKTTEKERLYIEAEYTNIIKKDQDRSFRILKQMARKYPKEKRVHFQLGFLYLDRKVFDKAIERSYKALELDPKYGIAINLLAYTYAEIGEFQKALEYYKKYSSVSPGDANPLDCIAETYLRMGDIDQSIEKYMEAYEVRPTFHEPYWKIAYIYAIKENYQETMKWIDQFMTMAPSPGVKAEAYLQKCLYNLWLGRFQQSSNDISKASSLAEEVENALWKAYANWMKGWIHFQRREFEISREHFKKWFDYIVEYPLPARSQSSLKFFTSQYIFYLGLVDLYDGRIDSSKSRLIELKNSISGNNLTEMDWLTLHYKLLNGEILLAENCPDEVIRSFEKPLPLGMPPYLITRYLLPYNIPYRSDVLARAYYRKGELDKAISEYEKLITFNPDSKDRRLIYPKYHYKLAILYEEKGMLNKAIEEYNKFIKIWKNADEDQPELIDAEKRLKELLD